MPQSLVFNFQTFFTKLSEISSKLTQCGIDEKVIALCLKAGCVNSEVLIPKPMALKSGVQLSISIEPDTSIIEIIGIFSKPLLFFLFEFHCKFIASTCETILFAVSSVFEQLYFCVRCNSIASLTYSYTFALFPCILCRTGSTLEASLWKW